MSSILSTRDIARTGSPAARRFIIATGFVILCASSLGCPRSRAPGSAAGAPESATPAPAEDPAVIAADPVLPGHGDVLHGAAAAERVRAQLGLPDAAIQYVDGPEYGEFLVKIADTAMQKRVLDALREARGGGGGKVWRVLFIVPGLEEAGADGSARTVEIR